MKKLYLDTETTGIDPDKHSIYQVGAIVEIDGRIEERVNMNIRPWEGSLISVGAVPRNMSTIDGFRLWLKEQPASIDQFKKFMRILQYYVNRYDKRDKFWFIAYNAQFDDKFMRAWFEKHNEKYYGSYFWWPPIDVAVLAAHHLQDERPAMENFQLETVATKLGVRTEGEAHDATVDIEWTRNIYLKVTNGRTS